MAISIFFRRWICSHLSLHILLAADVFGGEYATIEVQLRYLEINKQQARHD